MYRSRRKTIEKDICTHLRQGLDKKGAAKLAGISEKTFYRWVAENDSFGSRVEANILEYRHSLVKTINTHAIKNGMIALKILETRWPKDWKVPKNTRHDKSEDDRSIEKIVEALQEEDGKDYKVIS